MNANAPIYSLMVPDPDTVKPNDSLALVRELFTKNNYHHLPVLDDGKLVGLISKTDYLKVVCTVFDHPIEKRHNEKLMQSVLVKDVMAKNLVTLDSKQTIAEALQIFKENRFHALPIVASDGSLQGIVTLFDFLGLVEYMLVENESKPIEEPFCGTN